MFFQNRIVVFSILDFIYIWEISFFMVSRSSDKIFQ